MTAERCNPPACVLLVGHAGYCRDSWSPTRELCGEWMPQAKEYCARFAGHAGGWKGPAHRTRYALDNNRDARWFGVR